jgi:hypothetical protein
MPIQFDEAVGLLEGATPGTTQLPVIELYVPVLSAYPDQLLEAHPEVSLPGRAAEIRRW